MSHPRNPIELARQRRRRRELDEAGVREFRENDAAENAASAPPDDETIRLRGIWIADCYPISRGEDLLRRLRALKPRRRGIHGMLEGAISTLEGARTDPFRGGYSGEIPVVRPGSGLFPFSEPVELDLPESVDYMMAWLDAQVSALPTFMFQVHLTEEASLAADRALRRQYSSRSERHGSWTTYLTPTNQKSDAVIAERTRIVKELTSWMGELFPGLFASGALDGAYPMIEFWTTEEQRPFEPKAEETRKPRVRAGFDYMELMRWDRGFELWVAEGIEGAILRPVARFREDAPGEEAALELVARTADLFGGDDLKAYGDRETHGFMNRLHYTMFAVLSGWARRCALRGYEQEFASARQELRIASQRRRRGEVRRADLLADTELQLLQLRADLDPVLAYVRSTEGEPRRLRLSSADFILKEPLADGEKISWQDRDREAVEWFAERLERTVTELTEVSGAIIGVVAARANLRLQRHVRLFTLVAAVLAGVALYLQVK
jgi:hypothetical protein